MSALPPPPALGPDVDPGAEPDALVTRRAALRRVAWLLGGALTAPTVAGVLAGCGGEGGGGAAAARGGAAYQLRALTPEQGETVALVAEHILPETSTPGARAARVHEFVDRMLADFYSAEDRARFVAGLARLDARARRRHGRAFAACAGAEQYALVDALDAQAFGEAGAGGAGRLAGGGSENGPPAAPSEARSGVEGHSYTEAAGAPSGAAEDRPDPLDVGPHAFFRTMKELTLVGYYTSEVGARRELRVNPMGRWRPDVPYRELGRAWA